MSDNQNQFARRAMRPTLKTWLKHLAFLLITLCTATISGVQFPFGIATSFDKPLNVADDAGWLTIIAAIPGWYVSVISETLYLLSTNHEYLAYGLKFSISALFILISHEAGHYIACRIYGVDATLPYFIPTPPMLGPAGTLGAFIKILSPMPSRKAVFDIGVAGPLAGFIALIPIALLGVYTAEIIKPEDLVNYTQSELTFSQPLLMKFFALLFGKNLDVMVQNPFYYAAWLGFIVTGLNLLPSGQLDGGHAVFAVFGEKMHRWTTRIAFVVMVSFSAIGLYVYGSPSGILFTVILAVMLKVGHPQPYDLTPLDTKRKIVAVITLIVFILSFMPFPIQIN
jgi:membrane-associated protease RseP (regulator of RpoE activity)